MGWPFEGRTGPVDFEIPPFPVLSDETQLTLATCQSIVQRQVGISAVDIRDIAEAAAIALTSEGHFGKTYHLNGPDVLSDPKMASIWSGLLGKEVRYSGDDMDAFEEQMRKRAPSWSAFDIRMMFQGYLERGSSRTLLGHAPRRYEDFAKEAALSWQNQQAVEKPSA